MRVLLRIMPTMLVIQARASPSLTVRVLSMRSRHIRVQGMHIRGERMSDMDAEGSISCKDVIASTWMGVKQEKSRSHENLLFTHRSR